MKGVYDEPISRENLVAALYNALTIEYLSVQTFSGKDGLVLGKDKTLLEDLFHVSGKAGVLETAGMSTVNVAEELNKNTMSVSGEPFLCQGKNYENLLGYGVWVWYAQENGAASKTAVGVVALDRNNVLKIAAKDLAAGQTDTSQISYADKNGQTRTAKLADGVDVVKNGLPARADFNIPRGDITLVDNDGDKRYDAALIHTYETFAAKAATGNYLQDIDGNTYAINEENTTVYKDGASISLGEIRQWDAIVLEKTDSPTYDQRAKIYVSDAKIEGTIEAVSKKDGTTITIDGRQYAFDNNSAASKATVGLAATFSMNAYGDIVGVDTTKTNQYAYLFGVSVKEQRLADDEVTLRVLRQDGTWASLGMAEKIKINGQGKTPADFLADAAFISPEKKAVRQVMKIKTNGRDEITEITSAQAWQGPAVPGICGDYRRVFRRRRGFGRELLCGKRHGNLPNSQKQRGRGVGLPSNPICVRRRCSL